jgi:hypothetical protein
MPDPRTLKVGDLIRFTELPEEWSQPKNTIHRDTIRFMKAMIRRSKPSRIREIDEWGTPWIRAFSIERGKRSYHSYGILESTGWRRVVRRRRK